ncbi:gamma-aminobutyric acid receptor subunit beta-1 isoform X2 [Coturnix japonica]|nr:gamma-aminobutyric acid receptor subunit beta-1 isoform X2 [Coturnix japonica]
MRAGAGAARERCRCPWCWLSLSVVLAVAVRGADCSVRARSTDEPSYMSCVKETVDRLLHGYDIRLRNHNCTDHDHHSAPISLMYALFSLQLKTE